MWTRTTATGISRFRTTASNWLEVGSYGKASYLGTPNRILFGHMDMGGSGAYVTLGAWDDGAGILGS